jgi:SAM-dependent methyltransferase
MQPGDPAGADILEVMHLAPRYASWQVDAVRPFIGRRICEVGSGIGNIAANLLELDPELLLLTDTDAYYLERLGQAHSSDQRVQVAELTLPIAPVEAFARNQLDTVIAFNVIEHVDDDIASVSALARLVQPGGHVIVLVPALPALFGTLDVALQHRRRYTRAAARQLMTMSGLSLVSLKYFNAVGAVGWFVNSRLRHRSRLSERSVALFDRLVSMLRHEWLLGPPLGLSLIAVGQRVT